MTAALVATPEIHHLAREHLRGDVEQVGFFLADYDEGGRAFLLLEWRPMAAEAFEFQSAYHVTLADEQRPVLIKWAWDAKACLVEAHSHVGPGLAGFSPSDLWGFREWVPHVRWRLGGRPYGAVVTAADSFDALAWIEDKPEQIDRLAVGDETLRATGRTLMRPFGENDHRAW